MGLGFAAPEATVDLLEALAAIAPTPLAAVEIFERHVARAKSPADKLAALVRAYRGALDRAGDAGADRKALEGKAKELAEAVLSLPTSAGAEEAFEVLYDAARAFDDRAGGQAQRRALLETIATSTAGPRDGGRTRSANLRRAALRARNDLGDDKRALDLLAAALVAHVDAAALDAVEEAAGGDPRRAERVLSKALEEVFDGPLVRQILSRRATIRQEKLADVDGAISDLKKLHELAPADAAITQRLDALLIEANDYRGRIQLHEDQILRSKEQGARAELARQIARLWEERLGEAREAADAWRRVLRLKPQDQEATEGLDRAKRGKPKFEAGLHPPQREAPKPSDAPKSDAADTSPPAAPSPPEVDPASLVEPITTKITDAASASKLMAASSSRISSASASKLAAASAPKIPTSSASKVAIADAAPAEVTGDLDVSDAIETTGDVGVDETMRRSSTTTIVTAAPVLKRQSSAPPPLPPTGANKLPYIAKPIAPKVAHLDLPATTEEIAPPSAEDLANARSLPELADEDDDVPTAVGQLSEARAQAARLSTKTEEVAAVVIPPHLQGLRVGHADETGEIVGDDEFEVVEDEAVAAAQDEASEHTFADLAEDDAIEATRTDDVVLAEDDKSHRHRRRP
ncbi:MAG: hypothetical protein ACHREM_28885 [Polyangiales bacterium]